MAVAGGAVADPARLRHRTNWVPVAPLAAVMVLALVVGLARLAFTGTVRFASVPAM